MAKCLFKEIFILFMMIIPNYLPFKLIGHTHDNIDVSFGCCSVELHEEIFPIISRFMKIYMD